MFYISSILGSKSRLKRKIMTEVLMEMSAGHLFCVNDLDSI